MSNENPTSNWGMVPEVPTGTSTEATKEMFQLPHNAVVKKETPKQAIDRLVETGRIKVATPEQMKGVKFDQGKPRMELLPPKALNEVAAVFGYGSVKYSTHGWRNNMEWSRLIGASLRHITAWISGEHNDPESGYSHLSHAACNLLMLIECAELNLGKDDRWTK